MKKVIVSLLILFVGCDHIDNRLSVINRLNKTVAVHIDKDTFAYEWKSLLREPFYTDNNGDKNLKYFKFIRPNDTANFTILGYWDRKDNFDSTGNLYVFVIDSVDFYKNSDTKYLDYTIRRHRTSLIELRNNNWVIELK